MKSESTVINKLASGVHNLKLSNLPDDIIKIAKNCLIDIFGVTFAGSSTRSARLIQKFSKKNYNSGNCNILGSKMFLNSSGAAFTNATSAHALDFDDNCYAGIVHGSAVVFPAVLAIAQEHNKNGKDLLRGFISGLEVEFAIAKAMSNSIYDKGWWTTSLLGSIGSAAGVSSVLDLSEEETSNAMALAISGAGAMRAIRGTDAKHFYCGQASERGVLSAQLAKQGLTGPIDAFEDQNGIIKILNDGNFDLNPIDQFGSKFGLTNPGVDIKKYPVCFASHAAIDATKDIIFNNQINADSINSITIKVPELVASNLTYNNPKTVPEAQFSMQFAIASLIYFGEISLKTLNQENIINQNLQSLYTKIKMQTADIPDDQKDSDLICPEWGMVDLTTENGNRFNCFYGSPLGSSKQPISEEIFYNKFKSCVQYSDKFFNTEKLFQQLKIIERLGDIKELFT